MPVVSMFYGIIVSLYFMDKRRLGKVIEGSLPPSKMKLFIAWIEIHKDELAADWELAAKGEPVFPIEPLR